MRNLVGRHCGSVSRDPVVPSLRDVSRDAMSLRLWDRLGDAVWGSLQLCLWTGAGLAVFAAIRDQWEQR